MAGVIQQLSMLQFSASLLLPVSHMTLEMFPCCRIQRDIVDRGRDVAGVIQQYTKFVKPAFDTYVAPSRKHADVIVPWARQDAVMCGKSGTVCWLRFCSIFLGIAVFTQVCMAMQGGAEPGGHHPYHRAHQDEGAQFLKRCDTLQFSCSTTTNACAPAHEDI